MRKLPEFIAVAQAALRIFERIFEGVFKVAPILDIGIIEILRSAAARCFVPLVLSAAPCLYGMVKFSKNFRKFLYFSPLCAIL